MNEDQISTLQIRREQLELLIEQSSSTPIVSMIAAAVLSALLWDAQDHRIIFIFFSSVVATGLIRLDYFRRFRRSERMLDSIPLWERYYFVTMLLYFLAWGLNGLFLLPPESPVHQMTIMYFLIGMAGSAISVFSANRPVLVTAVIALLVPSILWFYAQGDLFSIGVALAGTAFSLSALRSSRILSQAMVQNHILNQSLRNAKLKAERLSQEVGEALEQARKANDAKSRFFASANHDLRQPIFALNILSTSLSIRKLDEKTRQVASGISHAVNTLSDQLDTFLGVFSLDSGVIPVSRKALRLDTLLHALEYEYLPTAAEHGITIATTCPEDISVWSDPVLLERIIRNVMANAINHNYNCVLDLTAVEQGDDWLLTIADSGKGIADDEKELIFEEFYQVDSGPRRPESGSGLGLSIVKRLANLLELDMQFESTEKVGTRFIFTLASPPRSGQPGEQEHDEHGADTGQDIHQTLGETEVQ